MGISLQEIETGADFADFREQRQSVRKKGRSVSDFVPDNQLISS